MRGYRSSLIQRVQQFTVCFFNCAHVEQLNLRFVPLTFPSKSIPSMLVKVKVDSNKIKDALRNGLDF